MRIEPYLFFNGRAEEAIEFYKKAVGAEVQMLMRFKDAPEQPPPDKVAPGSENKVMHASLKIGNSVLMLSDGMASGKTDFKGFSLSISVSKEADADRIFAALGQGGKVEMPLAKTFWAPKFGMVADKFGVGWMVNLEQ
jgi:PhnB protein